MSNKVLIILGMHRSGTSLTTSWLHKSGLNVGENLLGQGIGNEKGHYEDLDFFKLHEEILRQNNTNYLIDSTKDLIISKDLIAKAKGLISQKNMVSQQWGWKDPRTCIFIDLWNKLIPNAKWLVVYRNYQEVADSIMRRDIKNRRKRRNFIAAYHTVLKNYLFPNKVVNKLTNVWCNYHDKILTALKNKELNDVCVVSDTNLVTDNNLLYHTLTNQMGFCLHQNPINSLFDSTLIKKTTLDYNLNSNLENRAEGVMAKLQELERITFYNKINV